MGHLAVVQYLVQQRAEVSQSDSDESTPPLMAVHQGHLALLQSRMQQGAPKNKAANEGLLLFALQLKRVSWR